MGVRDPAAEFSGVESAVRDAAGQARCSDAAFCAGAGANEGRSGPGRALGHFGDEEGIEQRYALQDYGWRFRGKRQGYRRRAGKHLMAAGMAVEIV